MSEENEFVLRFHAMFALAASLALKDCLLQAHFPTVEIKDACATVGNTVFLLVVFWHLTIFLRGLFRYPRLLSYYRFLLPLSLWFVLPDWFLVRFAGTLEFPSNGSFWMIGGAVSPSMAGMWSIPGLLILQSCYPSSTTTENTIPVMCHVKAAIVGLVVFVMAEQCLPFVWTVTEGVVHRVGWGHGVAVYVLPAEILLGPTILHFYHATKDSKNCYHSIMGAGMTMLIYTGALSIGLLALEISPVTT